MYSPARISRYTSDTTLGSDGGTRSKTIQTPSLSVAPLSPIEFSGMPLPGTERQGKNGLSTSTERPSWAARVMALPPRGGGYALKGHGDDRAEKTVWLIGMMPHAASLWLQQTWRAAAAKYILKECDAAQLPATRVVRIPPLSSGIDMG